MLWRGEMGFRQPDALEVQWYSGTGELQMGMIEMWERWRRVGIMQRGEGEAPKSEPKISVVVSATSNETEAIRGEGGSSTRGVRGVGEGAEGRTPEAQQGIAGPHAGRKRSATAVTRDRVAILISFNATSMDSIASSPAGRRSTEATMHPPLASVAAARAATNEAAGKLGLTGIQTHRFVL